MQSDEQASPGQPPGKKKKKYTEEQLREKKRREKPYSYEYYVFRIGNRKKMRGF